jgi:hypothetical protein
MNIFRNFGNALKYANYNFFQLKEEVVSLVQRGRQYGYDVPNYCKITVKNSAKRYDYPVLIDLYYKDKDNDQQVIHLPQELLIGVFTTIPTPIKERLERKGFVEIVVENLAELFISASEEVSKPISFSSISSFSSNREILSSRVVTIKDELFAYRVKYLYNTPKSKGNVKVVSYADIANMPEDVKKILESDGICSLFLD